MRPPVRILALCLAILGGAQGRAYAQHLNAAGAPCRQPGGETSQCLNSAKRDADEELSRTYGEIESALRPEDQRKLQASERLWRSYRDAACGAERDLFSDATGAAPVQLACLEAETRHHAADLRDRYGWRK